MKGGDPSLQCLEHGMTHLIFSAELSRNVPQSKIATCFVCMPAGGVSRCVGGCGVGVCKVESKA